MLPQSGGGPQGPLCPQGPAPSHLLLLYQTSARTSREEGGQLAGTEPEKPEAQGLWSWVGGAAVLTLLGDVKQVPSSLSPQSPHLSNGVSSSPGAPLTWQMDEVPRQCWETVITLGKLRPRREGHCLRLLTHPQLSAGVTERRGTP